jgi:hypothetical protein
MSLSDFIFHLRTSSLYLDCIWYWEYSLFIYRWYSNWRDYTVPNKIERWPRIVGRLKIWRWGFTVYFKVLHRHLPREAERNYEKSVRIARNLIEFRTRYLRIQVYSIAATITCSVSPSTLKYSAKFQFWSVHFRHNPYFIYHIHQFSKQTVCPTKNLLMA